MVTIASGEWIADLRAMTCRNYINKLVVVFEKKGKALFGKINYMPMELLEKWALEPHGEKNMENAVMEAEEVFLRAYIENKMEKGEKV